MTTKKKSVKHYIDALVDDEGLRTEVTLTITTDTLWKIIGGLLVAGAGIALIAHLLKNTFPNKQLAENNTLLLDIKKSLDSS